MMEFKESVSEVQVQFLEDLGVYQRGYAPPGAVGDGKSVVFDNIELKQRLSLAGFNGAVIRTWMLGNVSMTTRTMMAVLKAANGGLGVRFPTVALKIEGKKVRRVSEATPAGVQRYIQGLPIPGDSASAADVVGGNITGHIELKDGPDWWMTKAAEKLEAVIGDLVTPRTPADGGLQYRKATLVDVDSPRAPAAEVLPCFNPDYPHGEW